MKTVRAFIAFKISSEVREELQRLQAELEAGNRTAHIKWTVPENFHITIHFNGDLGLDMVERSQHWLQTVARKHRSFSYGLDRLDAFPNWTRPEIIAVRVRDEGGKSRALQQELLSALLKAGLTGDLKPWQPHITIGRNKRGKPLAGWREIVVEKLVWVVDSIELMKSELNSAGPVYTALGSFPLSAKQ